jgi:1,4-alpha-glucan branching enzyme
MKKKGNKGPVNTDNTKMDSKKPSAISKSEGLKKQYVESKNICKVTFRLPKEAAPEAKSVTIVGDFNKWNITETRMKKLKNGDFTLTLELPCNREYSFRYLIDANRWEKDWFADKHIPGDSGVDDSVVVI